MIYFITTEEHHIKHYTKKMYNNIEVLLDSNTHYNFFTSWLENNINIHIGLDTETNGLDYHVNDVILIVIGNETDQFILHAPFCDIGKYLIYLYDRDYILLGHNIKFDLGMIYTSCDILFKRVYDTMIAEQRTYMKLGLKVGLDALCIRHLDIFPDAIDKSIRNEFIGVDIHKFKVKPKHLRYAAGDIDKLFPIKEIQEKKIKQYNLEMLLTDIEFPMIHIIAKAELCGFNFDTEKWKSIADNNIKRCYEIELALDKEVRRLRDEVWGTPNEPFGYHKDKRMYMSGGKWDNPRKQNPEYNLFNDDGTTNTLNLFGEPMKINTYIGSKAKKPVKIKKNPNNIAYTSDTQIIEIFGRLEEPLLNQSETLVIPVFNKNGKINREVHSYKTNEPAMITYLNLLPESKMKTFIELLLEHRGLSKAISTYGYNFINHLNPITGKLHTVFRQCFTETGRMSSGGGNNEPDKPNFQNIPSKASYAIDMRNCFRAREGYSIGTHDLSGAELIIMCSLSQDMKLLKIAREDIHSYVAQRCWRAIYQHRANEYSKAITSNPTLNTSDKRELQKKVEELLELATTYIVDKSKPKIRTAFKPMTFGTIYGMYAGKASKTLGISKLEGQIVIDIIKREFPDVFKMVEQAVEQVSKYGMIVLNERTNSRAWFPNIIRVLQGKLNPKDAFKIITKEQSEARNIRIQGTQADMIKECTVEIQKWIDDNDYTDKITILSWVHDEIVDEHPKYLDGKSNEWLNNRANTNLHYRRNDGTIFTHNNFPDIKAEIMRNVCNRYLHNVTMDVEYDVEDFWTK